MSHRAGSKPFTTSHVDRLCGSARAKDRLRVFLETMRGTLPVADACQLLELSEAQFHHARHVWLQESLELLEPRRRGRPPEPVDVAELVRQREHLEAELESLREQMRGAQVREEIARILSDPQAGPLKKTDATPSAPKPR